jgi:hypothetical protein
LAILHIRPFKYDYTATDVSSDHYHPAIDTLKPHNKMVMATIFFFARGGGIILVVKEFQHYIMEYSK